MPWFAGAWIVAWTWLLCASDVKYRRLPDALTLPPALVALCSCLVWPPVAAGLAWPALYLLVGRGGFGGGDVKLAVSLGVAVAAMRGVLGVLAAVAIAGACSMVLAWFTQSRRVAHGPSMLGGMWCVVAGPLLVSAAA